jgi:hypothetical protein
MGLMRALSADGLGQADHSALVRWYEAKAGVKVSGQPRS